MAFNHDHPEYMQAREVRTLVESIRTHLDGRFDLIELSQQQSAHTLNEVVRQQKETNRQVAKIQLWRARVEGQFQGVKGTAGGLRNLWFALTAAISTSVAAVGIVWTIVQRVQ